ncbi:MAG TPA: hypothetical protein VF821_32910 [Lentzea sp.]
MPLRDAVAALPVADEIRDGYRRDKFKLWTDADHDGCSTRAEVLIAEAAVAPEVGPKCALAGGLWYSSYDDEYVSDARGVDIRPHGATGRSLGQRCLCVDGETTRGLRQRPR